jgi:hypothetical protein
MMRVNIECFLHQYSPLVKVPYQRHVPEGEGGGGERERERGKNKKSGEREGEKGRIREGNKRSGQGTVSVVFTPLLTMFVLAL